MENCFMAIMKAFGTEAVRTTAYNPQKHDHVQRYNRTMAHNSDMKERRELECRSVAWVRDTFRATLLLVLSYGTHLWLSGSIYPRQISVDQASCGHTGVSGCTMSTGP